MHKTLKNKNKEKGLPFHMVLNVLHQKTATFLLKRLCNFPQSIYANPNMFLEKYSFTLSKTFKNAKK